MEAQTLRLRKLLIGACGLLAAGLAYAWVVGRLGYGLPCLFHSLTGLLCPGCGMSRLCLAALRGDWAAAWRANPALCLLFPPIAALLAVRGIGYVKGKPASGWESRVWLALAAVLLIFGIVRNLP